MKAAASRGIDAIKNNKDEEEITRPQDTDDADKRISVVETVENKQMTEQKMRDLQKVQEIQEDEDLSQNIEEISKDADLSPRSVQKMKQTTNKQKIARTNNVPLQE
ncbi:hypothetical protein K7X08_011868 [Anisodus acutangulus]|uniref:Uncharacterized protein n=1 Tax=Anisodus acutangulus TaxID=402998 RepID=A0A9Q1L9P4_9SOLA|nr:hypothetical protein K7X08_011868 [Anisodus acutangulus]